MRALNFNGVSRTQALRDRSKGQIQVFIEVRWSAIASPSKAKSITVQPSAIRFWYQCRDFCLASDLPDDLPPIIRKHRQYHRLIVRLPALWCDFVRAD